MHYDTIIIGGGAAGLFAAGRIGQKGQKVLVLERNKRLADKVRISGGGRCNFTNLGVSAAQFLSENPHFAKSAVARFDQYDFLDLVSRYNIKWHEKTLGQLFCDGRSQEIIDMLLSECKKGNVEIRTECHVEKVVAGFEISTNFGQFGSDHLIIATGGPAIPKMGASDFAHQIAKQFGLDVIAPRPALVPLTFGEEDADFKSLSGLSLEVITQFGDAQFREAMLFTYKGLSGPAILQISSYWQAGSPISVNLTPEAKAGWLTAQKESAPKSRLRRAIGYAFPDRLADVLTARLLRDFDLPDQRPLAEMRDQTLAEIEARLCNWPFMPNGTEGFAKAEVAAGGVATSELSSKTMEAKKTAGLYFIGEAVDVTGWLGGYNFQWAWSSAAAAADAILAK